MGKILGVVSLKGGVGKTSVVSALGAAMAGFDKKVLLIDGNLSAPNLGLHLKILDPEKTLHDVLARRAHTRDAIHDFGGFHVLPASMYDNSRVSPLKLKDRISNLKRSYDMILIDSSPALNEETLGVMLASDSLIVVTTPDYPTLSTTLKAISLARQRGAKIDGLIINKSHDKKFEMNFSDIEAMAEVPILAVIPHDVDVLKSLSEFKPSTVYKPRSKASEEYLKLAATLIGEKYKKKKFSFKKPSRQEVNRTIFYESLFG